MKMLSDTKQQRLQSKSSQRIKDFLLMRYINLRLLTYYLLTYRGVVARFLVGYIYW